MWGIRSFGLVCLLQAAGRSTYPIDDSVGFGRTFDGIGGLSGGGATSKLLMNYPEKERSEILDYLFKPNFGASLQILKVEIGGDAQSSDGSEASHMHNLWDENYSRGYEWFLMAEAKKRNPDILLYGLPWAFPGWVGNGTNSPYSSPYLSASYVAKWIQGAQKYHNLTIDYVGAWNEHNYDSLYLRTLKFVLLEFGLDVKVVAADDDWSVAGAVLSDVNLALAIHAIGAHYPGSSSSADALATSKPLWASEDYSTYNDAVGAGCWARLINQNYVNGFITSTIAWNLIASYYDMLPYSRNGLMTANEPWGGHYDVALPIWMTAHTTQFTKPGWVYLNHTAGGVGSLTKVGGSYVTLMSPDKRDITIVIETMSHNMSVCIRPPLPPFMVSSQDIVFQFGGSWKKLQQLHVWSSFLSLATNDSNIFTYRGMLNITKSILILAGIPPDTVITLTTLSSGRKGDYDPSPPSQPFPLPYSDDFESSPLYSEPSNFSPQVGSFEVLASPEDSPHKQILRQTVLQAPIDWCSRWNPTSIALQPIGIIGNYSWGHTGDIQIALDINIDKVNGSNGVFLALKVDRGGCTVPSALGKFFWLFPSQNRFVVSNDFAMKQVAISGDLADVTVGNWHRVALAAQGYNLTGYVDGKVVFANTLGDLAPYNGFVAFGTSSFGYASFDNLHIVQ